MEVISSLENENVKFWNKLNEKKYRDECDLFKVEGLHLVEEAIKSNLVKEIIMLEDSDLSFDNIQVNYVTKKILDKISSLTTSPDIMAVCYKLKEKYYGNKILLIDSLQDPGNLGTIIRTAVAFNIDTIVLGSDTVDLYNDKTIRATEGMLFHINIIKRDLTNFIKELKSNSYSILGTKVDGGNKLNSIKFNEKTAIIIGNEGSGVKEELLDLCDEYLYIPMNNKCESLNVSVATAIILYELGR